MSPFSLTYTPHYCIEYILSIILRIISILLPLNSDTYPPYSQAPQLYCLSKYMIIFFMKILLFTTEFLDILLNKGIFSIPSKTITKINCILLHNNENLSSNGIIYRNSFLKKSICENL